MMAITSTVQLIPYVFTVVIFLSIITATLMNTWMMSAELLANPLWGAAGSSSCALRNASDDVLVFMGSSAHSCVLQVNVSVDTSIQIQIHELSNNSDPDSYMYVENVNNCSDTYDVFKEISGQCSHVTVARDIKIHLHGGGSVTLTGTSTAVGTLPQCSQEDKSMEAKTNSTCTDAQRYSEKAMCTYSPAGFWHYQYHNGYCRMLFDTRCGVQLGPREALYDCDKHNASHRVFIPYPNGVFYNSLIGILTLDLSDNQITRLNEGSFQGLNKLKYLKLNRNMITDMHVKCFRGLRTLQQLELKRNTLIVWENGLFIELANLETLYLTGNQISDLSASLFEGLSKLVMLELGSNMLSVLNKDVFLGLPNLKGCFLGENKISHLKAGCFRGLGNLEYLDLSSNMISNLDKDVFIDLISLEKLYISFNKLTVLEKRIFIHLISLVELELLGNPLVFDPRKGFSALPQNVTLAVSQHEICECFYLPKIIKCNVNGKKNPYFTCDRLLSDTTLTVFMWLIGLGAVSGNIFALIWRTNAHETNKVNKILLSNLAISDSLMGIYMLIMGSADVYFGDIFPMHAENWRSGITCRSLGALSIISSEASVIFVMLISIDRFICISFPFSTRKLNTKSIKVLVLMTWTVSAVLGIVPSVLAGRSVIFYDNSHVCIGLPLALAFYDWKYLVDSPFISADVCEQFHSLFPELCKPTANISNGHYYSTALFIGFNAICYLVVVGCYIGIVRCVRKSAKRTGRSQQMDEQIRLTTKVTSIVATDFCCWFPVILLGILVQIRVITLSARAFAWCVTFVIPINSALNPFVYTVPEAISQCRKERREKEQRDLKNRNMQCQSPQTQESPSDRS